MRRAVVDAGAADPTRAGPRMRAVAAALTSLLSTLAGPTRPARRSCHPSRGARRPASRSGLLTCSRRAPNAAARAAATCVAARGPREVVADGAAQRLASTRRATLSLSARADAAQPDVAAVRFRREERHHDEARRSRGATCLDLRTYKMPPKSSDPESNAHHRGSSGAVRSWQPHAAGVARAHGGFSTGLDGVAAPGETAGVVAPGEAAGSRTCPPPYDAGPRAAASPPGAPRGRQLALSRSRGRVAS